MSADDTSTTAASTDVSSDVSADPETQLEGDTAAKVTAAAQAEIPDGTVDRVETDSDGSPYEAHVTKADGTQVVVKVAADFTVTSVDAMPAGGRHQRCAD